MDVIYWMFLIYWMDYNHSLDTGLMLSNIFNSRFVIALTAMICRIFTVALPMSFNNHWHLLSFQWLVGGLVAINSIFPYIKGINIPIDVHIFQRGGPTTNQMMFNDLFGILCSFCSNLGGCITDKESLNFCGTGPKKNLALAHISQGPKELLFVKNGRIV